MNKIVYNACQGGFGLSDAATEEYAKRKGITLYKGECFAGTQEYYTSPNMSDESFYYPTYSRHDKDLVEIVEQLGDKASGSFAKLRVYETSCNRYAIDEYDGYESVIVDYDDRFIYIE